MAKTTELKHDRVHLRMDTRTKRKLERAAAYEEMTVSRFVLANAMAAAERVIESRERVVLSEMDWAAFHNALVNPPKPNAALKKAARRYQTVPVLPHPGAVTTSSPRPKVRGDGDVPMPDCTSAPSN